MMDGGFETGWNSKFVSLYPSFGALSCEADLKWVLRCVSRRPVCILTSKSRDGAIKQLVYESRRNPNSPI